MSCKLCAWLCDWACARLDCASYRTESEDWERGQSNEWELWSQETDENRELIERAVALKKTDREAAFRLYLEAADAGSVWAAQTVGWHYHIGYAVAADFGQAQEYYRRAIAAGSWMATLSHARLLATHGRYDESKKILEDGVRAGFIPAYYWLAWVRYEQSPSRETLREIRPVLEAAARAGHPQAHWMLKAFLLLGKYGVREIPRGFNLSRDNWSQGSAATDAEEGPRPEGPKTQVVAEEFLSEVQKVEARAGIEPACKDLQSSA